MKKEMLKRRLKDKGLVFKEEVPGRIKGHTYAKLYSQNDFLMYLGIYEGELPYYYPWIELFGIEPHRNKEYFFGSGLEEFLIKSCSEELPPGGRSFVEYSEDEETQRELNEGVPPPLSRIGFLMLKHGFTWFKDWYFPEGFNEGGYKLQGEKPLNEKRRKAHMESIRKNVKDFTSGEEALPPSILKRADWII